MVAQKCVGMVKPRERGEQNGNGHEHSGWNARTGELGPTMGGDARQNGTVAEAGGVRGCDNDHSSDSSEDYPGKRRPPSPAMGRMITLRLKFGDKQEKVAISAHHRLRKVLRAFSERHLPPGRTPRFLAAGQVAFLNWTDTAQQARLKDGHVIKLLDMPSKSPVPEVAAAGSSSSSTSAPVSESRASTANGADVVQVAAPQATVTKGKAEVDLGGGVPAASDVGAGTAAAKPVTSGPAASTTAAAPKPKAAEGKPKQEGLAKSKPSAPASKTATPTGKGNNKSKLGVDYSKWDKLELSDEEDDDGGEWRPCGSKEASGKDALSMMFEEDDEECLCHNTDCIAYECCLNREVKKVLDDTRERSNNSGRGKLPLTTPSTPARKCKNLMTCACDICQSLRFEALTALLAKKEGLLNRGHSRQPITVLHKYILKCYGSVVSLYLRAHGLSGTGQRNNKLVQLEAVHFTKREAFRRKQNLWFDLYAGHNPNGESHGRRCACRACMLAELCVDLGECIALKSRAEQVKFFEVTLKQLNEKQGGAPKGGEGKGRRSKGIDYSKWEKMSLDSDEDSEDEDGMGAAFSSPATYALLDTFMSVMTGAHPPNPNMVKSMAMAKSMSEQPVCMDPNCTMCQASEDLSPDGSRPNSPPTKPAAPSPKAAKKTGGPSQTANAAKPRSGAPKPATPEILGNSFGGFRFTAAPGLGRFLFQDADGKEVPFFPATAGETEDGAEAPRAEGAAGNGAAKKAGKKKKGKNKDEDGGKEKGKEKKPKEKAREGKEKEQQQAKAWTPRQCRACNMVESRPKEWQLCSSCCSVHYCSADCQRRDWKSHKAACIELAKQKAAAK